MLASQSSQSASSRFGKVFTQKIKGPRGEKTQLLEALGAEREDRGVILGTHMVERETRLLQTVF